MCAELLFSWAYARTYARVFSPFVLGICSFSSVMIDVCVVSYNVLQVCDCFSVIHLKRDMHTDLQTSIIGVMGTCDTLYFKRQSCTLTYFMRQSVHLWSLELRLCLRRSHGGAVCFHTISSNSLCGSVVNKMATMNLMYKCIIVLF